MPLSRIISGIDDRNWRVKLPAAQIVVVAA
jgi:hypothetical protein